MTHTDVTSTPGYTVSTARISDDTLISALQLSARCKNALANYLEIQTVGQLRRTTDRQLLRMPGFGRLSLQEVRGCVPFEPPPYVVGDIDYCRQQIEYLKTELENLEARLASLEGDHHDHH